ncbi:MAG: UbiD family decarboxylase [Proteobacteria bacterium]|nr:UbiD family decarboxylase [Pseudomonadota bacterium]
MAHYDLREYLEKLDKAGEFRRHTAAVDTKLEVGAIAQRIAEKGGPAIQFTGVAGGPDGASLVGATMNRGSRQTWAKVAHTLEMDPLTSYHAMLEEVVRRMDSTVKPMQVRTGPCKENVLSGADIDLEKMLAPWIHGDDGGRCVSSWGFTVVQEPGSNFLVWDIVPHLIHGSKELVAPIKADSPLGKVYARHKASATPMPFAIVLGGSPVAALAAAFHRRRSGSSTADVAGGLQRNPMQLVKCESSELLVPATAEMVIEGVVYPTRTAAIGAFPGSFGYVTERQATSPLWEVTTITHRNKPVLPFSTWGVPITETHLARSLDCDVQLKQEFIKRGTPAAGVYTPPWLAGSAVAIGTKVPFTAFSQSIAGIVRSTEGTKNIPYVLVFDDDIDVTNPISMFHALVTKCRPGRDTWQIHNTCAATDAPYLDAETRALGKGAAMIFDCTWPLDWDRSIAVPPRVSFDQCYPKDLQEKILAAWSTELGFPKESERPVAPV